MGPWTAWLLELLREDAGKPERERRNGQWLNDTLVEEGLAGSHLTLQRAVRAWKRDRDGGRAFIPLSSARGEAPISRLELSQSRAKQISNEATAA
jgi:hypothetical protein